MICVIAIHIGDFLNRLRASEDRETIVNSIGDILEEQVRKRGKMQNVPAEYVLIAVFSLHNSLVEKTVKK